MFQIGWILRPEYTACLRFPTSDTSHLERLALVSPNRESSFRPLDSSPGRGRGPLARDSA